MCESFCAYTYRICTCMHRGPETWQGSVGARSLGAAGGSAGLVEAHGFAQPASKVHFLHF